jgi:hypothetical protein
MTMTRSTNRCSKSASAAGVKQAAILNKTENEEENRRQQVEDRAEELFIEGERVTKVYIIDDGDFNVFLGTAYAFDEKTWAYKVKFDNRDKSNMPAKEYVGSKMTLFSLFFVLGPPILLSLNLTFSSFVFPDCNTLYNHQEECGKFDYAALLASSRPSPVLWRICKSKSPRCAFKSWNRLITKAPSLSSRSQRLSSKSNAKLKTLNARHVGMEGGELPHYQEYGCL